MTEGTLRPRLLEADMSDKVRAFLRDVPETMHGVWQVDGGPNIYEEDGRLVYVWSGGNVMSVTYELLDLQDGWIERDGMTLLIGPYRAEIVGRSDFWRVLYAVRIPERNGR